MYNEVIKRMREVQIELLNEVDRICSENDIKYQLFAGTLLGAVRHKGYIPWDDDIDICMPRKDYNKFLEVSNREIGNDFYLETPQDKDALFAFTKLRKKNTIQLESYTKDKSKYNGIFIDIFQMDKIPSNKFRAFSQRIRLNQLQRIRVSKINTKSQSDSKFKSLVKRIINFFYRKKITFYNNKIDKLASKYNSSESIFLASLTCPRVNKHYNGFVYKKHDFDREIRLDFEGKKYPSPKRYNDLLTQQYGDYMTPPPVSKRIPHHGVTKIGFGTEIYNIDHNKGKMTATKESSNI